MGIILPCPGRVRAYWDKAKAVQGKNEMILACMDPIGHNGLCRFPIEGLNIVENGTVIHFEIVEPKTDGND